MNGFMISPAMAKLVALQMVQEQAAESRQARKTAPSRTERRALRASARVSKKVGSARRSRPAKAQPAQ